MTTQPEHSVAVRFGFGTDVTHETWGVENGGTPVDVLPLQDGLRKAPICETCGFPQHTPPGIDSCLCGDRLNAHRARVVKRVKR
jgi:hypothetical protein